jgi:glycosyltransferase involved in cell wall biosynthesis
VSGTKGGLRVVVLAPFAPRHDAPHGGGRSLAQLVTHLGQRHRLGLLCLRPEGDPPPDEQVRAACDFAEEFELPGVGGNAVGRWRRRARLLRGLAAGTPMWVADCRVASFAKRLDEVVDAWRPDVVQAEFHVMGAYLPPGDAAVRVLTQHEPGSTAAIELVHGLRGPARWLARADALAWVRYESRVLRKADAVVVYSDRDRRALEPLASGVRFERIPLATDLPPGALDPAGVSTPTVVFAGNFMHPPNVDAALRLAQDIFPLVVREVPDARLYLVGDRAPRSLRHARDANVTVTGRVEDVVPYLADANVVVAPLRRGGGTRVKVLEALAFGKALVASPLALAGVGVEDGVQVLVADGDDAFAAAVVRVLRDVVLREQLGKNARRWAEENLGWKRTIAAYDRLYAELLAPPSERPRT